MKKLILIISVVFACFNSMKASNPYEDLQAEFDVTTKMIHISGHFDYTQYYIGSISFSNFIGSWIDSPWFYCLDDEDGLNNPNYDFYYDLSPYYNGLISNPKISLYNYAMVGFYLDCIPLSGYTDDSGNTNIYIYADTDGNIIVEKTW